MENTLSPAPTSLPSWLDFSFARRITWNAENVLALVILALALVSRFYDLGARVMSHDETNHVVPAYDFSQGRGYRYDPVTHGPLQFHLIALSYVLFSDNDFTSRIPAAVFSVATIGLALFAFRRYLGRWGALAAGVFFLISPYMLFYGRYARNEAFIVFWGLATLYALLRYLERGEPGVLLLFTLINALHFTDKATAYIFAAEQFLFLGGYFVFHMLRRLRGKPDFLIRFVAGLAATVFFGALAAGWYLADKSPAPQHQIYFALLALPALAGGIVTVIVLVRSLGWAVIRTERSFDLMLLLGTLILPLMAALPVKLIGRNPIDYSTTGILVSAAFIVPLILLAVWLGLWWNARAWPTCAALFYIPFVLLYTTFFTNSAGLAGGLMGALGYWMEQQGVSRGSQPLYYYLLLQIPVYEFLPAIGALVAVGLGLAKRLWQAQPEKPFEPALPAPQAETREAAQMGAEAEDPLEPALPAEGAAVLQAPPTLALFIFWSVSSLVAFSFAGEKMPWLTTHIALPLILAAAWAVGYLIETTHWAEVRRGRVWAVLGLLLVFFPALLSVFDGFAAVFGTPSADSLTRLQSIAITVIGLLGLLFSGWGLFNLLSKWDFGDLWRGTVLAVFAGLAVLTARAAYRAAYINYDTALEYLVYAHGAPAPKRLMTDIQALSLRTTDDLNLVVAYDNYVRYPYWWYMRHYPNKIDFNESPTNDIRRAPIILVGEENQAKVRPIVHNDYVEYSYVRMWWPNQDYWRLKWEDIDNERKSQTPAPANGTLPPMPLPEYLWRVGGHISPFFTDARVRSAILSIWLNRDYAEWAALQNSQSFTLQNWSPSDRMYVYIRKDVAGQLGGSGSQNPAANPTSAVVPQFNPNLTFGQNGIDPGQFQAPRALAVAPDGTLYVADARNHRIQHLDATGAVLKTWGTFADSAKGAAAGGTFNEPWGVAVGPDGAVYVADTWNHRVQKFSADGNFITLWGTWQSAAGQPDSFWGPRGIAVSAKGQVFVTDTGNKRVVVFDANGAFITQFGTEGDAAGQFKEPVGVAVDTQGRVYVADTWNQRVQVFAPDAAGTTYASASTWPVDAWFGQSLDNKPYLALTRDGQVLFTDPDACQVVALSATGQVSHIWSGCSTGADGFGKPAGVAVDNTGFWVSDAGNNRLLHFPLP